jgi:Zn ribbon nucleic-acid-binding protein
MRFGVERGFSESFYIVCPVCWNAGIKMTRWEDGSLEESECSVCRRRDEPMEK